MLKNVEDIGNNSSSQYLILNIGRHYFAVDVSCIEDVIKNCKTTSVPLSKSNITGVLNLRGHIVTEINVAKTLHIDTAQEQEAQKDGYIVVISIENEFYSFSFSGIGDVITVRHDEITSVPETVQKNWHQVAKGIYRLPEQLLVILDLPLFIDMILKKETPPNYSAV